MYDALGRREIVSILFKHSKLLLLLFVGAFALVFGASYIFTPQYKAEARILVQSGREFAIAPEKGTGSPAGVPTITKQEIMNSEAELLTSRDLIENVIKAVGMNRIYPDIAGDGDPEPTRMNDAIKKFNKKYKIEPVTMSNIITLAFWNPNRVVAIEVLRTLAEKYSELHAEVYGNKQSGFLGGQANDYEKQLEDLSQKIVSLKAADHLSDIAYERQQLIQDRSDVEAKLRDLKTKSIDAHRALNYYQQQLGTMSELVVTNENSADAVETAKSRLLELETQMLQLKQRFADDNPNAAGSIEDLQQQIDQIKTFIKDPAVNHQVSRARNLTYDDGRMKLQSAQASVPAIDETIAFETSEDARIVGRLKLLDDGEAQLDVLTRQQDTLKELVHNYRDRFEEAKTSAALDKQTMVSVSMIHQPESDEEPDKPKHWKFALAGVAFALLCVGLTALYLLMYRDSIITTESLQRLLKLRVLTVVPDFV